MAASPGNEQQGVVVARLLVNQIDSVVAEKAEWSQIREFRRDKVAKRDYRGILQLHQILEKATGETHALELLEIAKENYNQALVKHGLNSGGGGCIQLVATMAVSSFNYIKGADPETVVVNALSGLGMAAYQLLTGWRSKVRSRSAVLIVKAQGFVERVREADSQRHTE